MIAVFVGNEDGTQVRGGKTQAGETFLGLPARYTGIDQHRIGVIADIITVSIAAGIEGGDIERHPRKNKYTRFPAIINRRIPAWGLHFG